MHDNSGQTTSVWMQTQEVPADTALTADFTADVCIVGAGIAGLSTAYLLLEQDKSVVILDDGPVAAGQTQRTTAHLTNAIDDRYVNLEIWHGAEGARLAADSHSAAIDRIESIVARENIHCDFERLDGYLFSAPQKVDDLLNRELAAAHRAGLTQVEMLPCAPIDSFNTGPCLRFPRQGQFHPLKYMAGLSEAIQRMGGHIFTSTHVEKLECGPPARITTAHGSVVTANAVVIATNTPFNDWVTIHTKQAPYLTYAMAFAVSKGSIPRGLYWDTEDPYHYVRLQALQSGGPADTLLGDPNAEELLIVGGEDHKTGQSDDAVQRYNRLEDWTRHRFHVHGDCRARWSGQVFETIDGLAFIGRNPLDGPSIYIATGDSGQGMTHGTIAGILLSDLIVGRKNPWESLYDPARKTIRAAGHYLQENLNVAAQYGDWITGGDVASELEILSGTGAVLRQGMSKIAVYRDDDGNLHQFSATCPHLGCIVHWNHGECTWDCPCHGSRFDKDGHLLIGPANVDLTPLDMPATQASTRAS